MDARGERFRSFALLQSKNLSAFAETLGVQPQNLNRYVNGDRLPSSEILKKIAALGCNIHWLVTGEGSMFADNEAGRELAARAQSSGKRVGNVTLLGHYMESDLADMPVYEGKLPADVVEKIVSLDELQVLERVVDKLRQLHQPEE